jgi:cytoskeletal protein CcmA (bactofilin family)
LEAFVGKEVPTLQLDPRQGAAATVVARDTRFEGQITGSRAVRLEGSIKGMVQLKAPLEVVEGATLEAEVHATVVRVAGSVVGNITATELVELLASANVKGDVAAPALHVVEGAKLEGRVQMRAESVAPKTASPPPGEIPKSR